MSDDTRREKERKRAEGVSRRQFLERTAPAGGAALAATTISTAAQQRKTITPAKLTGEMVEYK